ncbi:MAG: diacylglycerol kinase family protein [Anaerolineae bacterium]|nr:diacylglycerol kinase family protein [Anaerolineae bacterium]
MSKLNRWQSFRCALSGVAYVLRTQRNAHIELVMALLAVAMGIILQVTRLEWALLVLVIGMVFTAEMINTATEHAVDLATNEWDPLARVAKDAAAAGVLVASLTALIIGILIFGPRLWALRPM